MVIRNASYKTCKENQYILHVQLRYFPPRTPSSLWGKEEKYARARQAKDDSIIWRMRSACQIPKATDTHSEYVMHIVFQQQRWIRERASVLRYTTCTLHVL
jgi:hypothetical protein